MGNAVGVPPKRDRLGTLVKFNPPTLIAGRVYVPNYENAVNVYGLLPQKDRQSGRPVPLSPRWSTWGAAAPQTSTS
jgi:hypothetical protein